MGWRRALVPLFLCLTCAVVMGGDGDHDPPTGVGGLKLRAGVGTGGNIGAGYAYDETVFVAIVDKNNPHASLTLPGDFTSVVEDDNDGAAIRYGQSSSANPDSAYNFNPDRGAYIYRSPEDDHATVPFIMYVCFNISTLSRGEVLDAELYLCMMNFSTFPGTGGYFAARLDTVAADQKMVDTASPYDDSRFLATTHNKVDGVNDWSPALSARDDWHDFGPSSERFYPPALAASEAFSIGVTDAVQQAVDLGLEWAIFAVYCVDTAGTNYRLGFSAISGNIVNGNPALTVKQRTRRGDREWAGTKVPFVFMLDDGYESHKGFFDIITGAGREYGEVVYRSGLSGADRLSQAGWDSINESPLVDFIVHGKTHRGLGTVQLADSIDVEISRDWVNTNNFAVPRDEGTLQGFAWPGAGDVDSTYAMLPVSRMIDAGYRWSRTAATDSIGSEMGRPTPLSWDSYVNMYGLYCNFGGSVFGSGGSNNEAETKDAIEDLIDYSYTDLNRSAALVYIHRTAVEGFTNDHITWLVEHVESLNSSSLWPLDRACRVRLSGSPFVEAGNVSVANGSLQYQEDAAALHDAWGTTNTDTNVDLMWVGPK